MTYFRLAYNSTTLVNHSSQFSVNNISERDVVVTLRLYNADGDTVGAPSFPATVYANGHLTSCNATNTSCTLPAGKSGVFVLSRNGTNVDTYGYGILDWSSTGTDSNPTALVASGMATYTSPSLTCVRPILITREQPF